MRSQPVLCRACGRDWRDETSQNGKSTLALGCLQGLDLRGHERNSIEKKLHFVFQKALLERASASIKKKKITFIFIFFILLTAKVYQNSSLKIFALAAYAHAFFLLSANIYQATFSVRKGVVR